MTRKDDVLRGALGVGEAIIALRDLDDPDANPGTRRDRVARAMLRKTQAGECLRLFMTHPDGMRHDVELALAELSAVNGWEIPTSWDDPCITALREAEGRE